MRRGSFARYTALAGAILAISCAAIWIKLARAPALTIAGDRMLVAVAALLPVTLLFARSDLALVWAECTGEAHAPSVRTAAIGHWRIRQCFWLTLAGLGLAAHFGLWTVSLGYTTVASSVVFVSTHPVFVGLAEWAWLRQRPGRLAWLGIGLTLFGSLIIGWGDLQLGGQAVYGDVLALGGALVLVGYLLIGRRVRSDLGFLTYNLLVFAPCWLALLLVGLAVGANPLDFAPGDPPLLLALGLVSTLGGHAVFNWALRHVAASVVAGCFVAEPAMAALLAWIFLLQQPPPPTLIGGAVILLGIYLVSTGTSDE